MSSIGTFCDTIATFVMTLLQYFLVLRSIQNLLYSAYNCIDYLYSRILND